MQRGRAGQRAARVEADGIAVEVGEQRDVTRQAVYLSNAAEVADVDANGLVRSADQPGLVAVMAVTALGLALARSLAPEQASRVLAGVTAAFALGQIIGPVIGGALAERTGSFTEASLLAAAGLVLAGVLGGLMPRRH